ncbi:hypothetical protein EHO59_06205 [Leptospira semungkisensis]|uniref:Leucine-rich repeat domain-containing protein n=1 Tax=Leptospira semungkisensis TaxID=2484985 RepID=A0A4R9G9F5_9LEPT|nr:hypothetical protein [Leptospira semungkisensis]TGK07690.1 hypothetical protein EHO59_06205 [Leptospira semungkisensis]
MTQKIITDPVNIPIEHINMELAAGHHVIVQFSEKYYDAKKLKVLNDLCAANNRSFGVRFFGFPMSYFDCSALDSLPDVKCLYLDSMHDVTNLEKISDLKYLEKLSLGIFNLTDTEILAADNLTQLEELFLGDTKSKALNLQYLSRFSNLRILINSGHLKNIDAIASLKHLSFLGLYSISKVSLDFVNPLSKLETLHLILGGRSNINEVINASIEHLHIVRVRGFDDFKNIARFPLLRSLLIEDQIQLRSIAFEKEMASLQDVRFSNCKNLKTIFRLQNLSHLSRLLISRTQVDFQSLASQKFPDSLKQFTFHSGRSKVDAAIKDQLQEMGYSSIFQ